MNKVAKTLSFLLLLICFGCEQKPPYRIPKYPEIEQDIYFEGDYPPVVQVTYEEKGFVYYVDAVQGQIMVMFKESVSHAEAFEILKNSNVKIVAQLPNIHYYLVEVPVGKEDEFLCLLRKIPKIDFVYPNAVELVCSVIPCVIDNFEEEDHHGDMVVAMMENGDGFLNPIGYDAPSGSNGVNTDKALGYLNKILNNLAPNDGAVINLSYGPMLIKFWNIIPWQHRVLWNDRFVTEENRLSYKRKYINGLKRIINLAKQFDEKDFVIVKCSGNEGMKELEVIIEELRSELPPKEQNVFDRHFILVSAKDDNKERDYPNDVSVGHYNKMITKVDISDMTSQDLRWQGTSFSSPRAAGFIANAAIQHNKRVVDVLAYAKVATKYHPEHLLTMEGLSELIEKKNPFEGHEEEWNDYTPSKTETGPDHGIPSGLVGTKWTTPEFHDNWTGQKQTIDFVSQNQVRITYTTLFYWLSTSKNLPAPQGVLYDCYYNEKENRIDVLNISNHSCVIMKLKYKNGRLIKPSNIALGDIEYERIGY